MSDRATNRICERCASEFRCGVADGTCWCFQIEVPPEARLEIGKLYKDCLCPACLTAIASATASNQSDEKEKE